MTVQVALRAKGLRCRYGQVVALDGISFEVRRGETFGLIGPDGAGKTTALRAALGLVAPEAGEIETLGLVPTRERRRLGRRVGYVSQSSPIYPDLTVQENMAFYGAIHGVRDLRRRSEVLLERFRLAPFRDRLAERLSGGMKQKLALACTLVRTPELLVLDEPTSGIDPVTRREFWSVLTELEREGVTILLATPYLDEAERCRRVALLDRGRILALGEPGRLCAEAGGVVLELQVRPRRPAVEALRLRPGVVGVESFGQRLHVTFGPREAREAGSFSEQVAAELRRAGIEVDSARLIRPSLEDVFIARIRKAGEATAGENSR